VGQNALLAVAFGVGIIGLQVAYLYSVLGPEWFAEMLERMWRRKENKRPDDDDDTDRRGIGGGFA
jgi:hypothetical protein